MKPVTNTTEELKDPEKAWEFILQGASGRPILDQEAQGQRELVHSGVLPTKIGHGEKQEEYEALGFVFGDVVEGDELFRYVTLPKGWYREADASHSMWSFIMDDTGKQRVNIFYKAAFYDRSAHMYLVREGGD